ncbi:hypothetical protein LAZ67_1001555 [Cordylochernes scorpioides]|uniref:Uncharacterized protein n=1 Tax=Cordylochernes scorpioides TaxID=51811 RepID=A0ABY6JVH2_9ARAC|nr:hypothetical protein LAZ67_1001555 [Cordylochernes scorpioides]
MLTFFKYLLSNEAFVDVTLACEGLSLKAHKMVLASCSPFFQSLFLENVCKHPIVILNGIKYVDLKSIIDFMYMGEINVAQEQMSSLLKAAETLKVIGLAEITNEAPATSKNNPETNHIYFSRNFSQSGIKRSKTALMPRKIRKSKKKVITQILNSDSEDQGSFLENGALNNMKGNDKSSDVLPKPIIGHVSKPKQINILSSNPYCESFSNIFSNSDSQLSQESETKKSHEIEPVRLMEQTLKVEECILHDEAMPLEMPVKPQDDKGSDEKEVDMSFSREDSQDNQPVETSQARDDNGEAPAKLQEMIPQEIEAVSQPGPSGFSTDKHAVINISMQPSDDEDGVYVCSVCEKHFPKIANLKWHYHRAHSTKQFPCPMCNKSFKTRDLMNQHTRVHRPNVFNCEYCPETFRWRSSLKAHKQKSHQSIAFERHPRPHVRE